MDAIRHLGWLFVAGLFSLPAVYVLGVLSGIIKFRDVDASEMSEADQERKKDFDRYRM